jgi:apolipoprotein N-acyltransferase
VRQIRRNAWLLVLLSAALQVLSFPLPGLYVLSWIALTPLVVAILRARTPETIQLDESQKLIPATPWQGFSRLRLWDRLVYRNLLLGL